MTGQTGARFPDVVAAAQFSFCLDDRSTRIAFPGRPSGQDPQNIMPEFRQSPENRAVARRAGVTLRHCAEFKGVTQ